uniref:Uncharacterized protein n=1 Tax=Globodera pallida TaxID=36090 RepID=A0A183BHV9_GLOPA
MTVSVVLIPLQLMLIVVGAVFVIITQCCGCKKKQKKADEAQPDADQQQGTASTPLTTAEVQNTAYQTLAQGQPPFTAALGTISQRPSPAEPSPTSAACATNYALSDPNAISMKGSPPSQMTTKMSSREPSIGATNYALDSPTGSAKTPSRESASFKGGGMHGAVSQRSSHGTMNATNYAMT